LRFALKFRAFCPFLFGFQAQRRGSCVSARFSACWDVFRAVNVEFLSFVGLFLWRATSRTPGSPSVDLFVWIWTRL